MDRQRCFSRTEKGRMELVGSQRVLKPKQRQVLFLIGESVSLDTLARQLPNCEELQEIVQFLWHEGYIAPNDSGENLHDRVRDALAVIREERLEAARQHALSYLAPLIGANSPACTHIREARDLESFRKAVSESRRILAAVASVSKALAFETGVLAILNLPAHQDDGPQGLEAARRLALETLAKYVGERSPAYARVRDAKTRAAFLEAVRSGRRILAAAASASKAAAFAEEVMQRLGPE